MDILSIVRDRIDKLPDGEHPGLKAVVNHIEVAIRHLHFGQSCGDDQLFTDAVYRCNQAYEGSIKELYRVVAGKDSRKITPQKVEEFLEKSNILRHKVLTQLKRYRQEWRNPSTHDYTLDFDEDEAFLAIVNIAAFAQTAVGQIASKLAFDLASQTKIQPSPPAKRNLKSSSPNSLIDSVGIYVGVYLAESDTARDSGLRVPEGQIASMLAGFLSSLADVEVEVESPISEDKRLYADILVRRADERCVVEIRSERSMMYHSDRGLEQLRSYMDVGGIESGVLVIYSDEQQPYSTLTETVAGRKTQIVLPVDQIDRAMERWGSHFKRYDLV